MWRKESDTAQYLKNENAPISQKVKKIEMKMDDKHSESHIRFIRNFINCFLFPINWNIELKFRIDQMPKLKNKHQPQTAEWHPT